MPYVGLLSGLAEQSDVRDSSQSAADTTNGQVVVQDVFGILNTYLLSLLSFSGEAVFVSLFFAVPALAALLITLGDWKVVLKAMLIWFVGGFAMCLFATIGNVSHALHMWLLYGMFFSVFAVPSIALILKLVNAVRGYLTLRPL